VSEHDFSRLGARLLAQNIEEPRARGLDREQGIAIVARAINERTRRKQRTRVLAYGAAFSAAAAVALVAGFLGARQATAGSDSGSSCVALGTCSQPAPSIEIGTIDGQRFAPGQTVAAHDGRRALVEFGRGTEVALDPSSELEYRQGDSTRRFGLLHGSVHLRVGKLRPGQRFVVETPDAEVEVRGTAFTVALSEPGSGCASPRTSVSVDEGVVEVRFHGQSYRITPGGHWPERCDAPAAPAALPATPPEAPPASEALHATSQQRTSAKAARTSTKAPALAAPSESAARTAEAPSTHSDSSAPLENNSGLSEQNNLYAKAVAARRSGRLGEAIATYDQLLDKFPNGALAESARGDRLKILIRLNPSRAKLEAARYLARYPRGLASAEARALLGEP
jgi:ferric-dicitrate binding protein FerR (iron transport regulator)